MAVFVCKTARSFAQLLREIRPRPPHRGSWADRCELVLGELLQLATRDLFHGRGAHFFAEPGNAEHAQDEVDRESSHASWQSRAPLKNGRCSLIGYKRGILKITHTWSLCVRSSVLNWAKDL